MARVLCRRILSTVLAMLQGIGAGACSDFAFAMRATDQWDGQASPIAAP